MAVKSFVVDPSGTDCYGKYRQHKPPEYIPDGELVEVDDLSEYSVLEWRYDS